MKHVLFDADGVVIHRHKYFSVRLSEDYGVDLELVTQFFKKEYGFCARGEADLKEELAKYLPAWGYPGTVDDLIEYWFSSEADIDEDALKVVASLRDLGISSHLASDNEHYRAEYLLNELELAKHFDQSFFSCDLKATKGEKEFFEKVLAVLEAPPEEVFYWDDDPKNIAIAASVGIPGQVYKDIIDLKDWMKGIKS